MTVLAPAARDALAAVIAASNDGILLDDDFAEVIVVNPRFAEISGLPESWAQKPDVAALGARWEQLFVDPRRETERVAAARTGGRPVTGEEVALTDGRALERDYTPVPLGDGRVGHFWTIRDVTDRRLTEARLSSSERRFQALAARAPIGIFASDGDGAPVFFNERCGELFGLPTGGTGPVDWTQQLLPDDIERAQRAWQEAVETGNEFSIRYALRAPDGALRHLDVRAGPVPDADGRLLGFVGTVVDATELVETASALELRNDELHQLARSRDDLVAAVSHELRTPLTSIVMFLDLLADDPLNKGQRDALTVVRRNTDRLEHVIGDLLLLKDAGELELAREPVELGAVAADAVEALSPRAADAGLALTLTAPEKAVVGRGDRARVAQILDVLLDNALKYTPRGGNVAVRIRRCDGEALLEVQDDGIGIAREDHERVFELFFRGQPSRQRGSGFGFGLAIVQLLAAAMDARVSLRSQPGDGSTFTLALPVER